MKPKSVWDKGFRRKANAVIFVERHIGKRYGEKKYNYGQILKSKDKKNTLFLLYFSMETCARLSKGEQHAYNALL